MSIIDLNNLINDPSIIFAKSSALTNEEFFKCDKLLLSLKQIVDPVIKANEGNNNVLDEIYVDGLDATQVWGQVKLVFDNAEKSIWDEIDEFKSKGMYKTDQENDNEEDNEVQELASEGADVESDDVSFGKLRTEDNEDKEEEEKEEEEEEEKSDFENEQNKNTNDIFESETEEVEKIDGNDEEHDAFGLNDGIFNLDDYKRQVLALEDDVDLGDEEEVDLFADLSDDDSDDEMYTYNDFFDPTSKDIKNAAKSNRKIKDKKDFKKKELNEAEYDAAYDLAQADIYGDEEIEEEQNNSNKNHDEHLSTFEKQQRELQRQIAELEAESIAEKKWTMKGEVSGKQRESDTLLEEEVEFDRTAKPVPVITQETTETIEEIIKRRIINQEFDEIQKRIISELNNFKSSKKVQVSEEKSTKSLAELYEDEYANKNGDEEKINEELKNAHDEISSLFKDITYQLDSLYSSHFVPKPKEKLLDVRVETSTISMEDAQPLTMAASNTLAPQEVYKTGTKIGKDEVVLRSGVVMAKAELERDDKQRLHRARKRKQHLQSKDESLKKKKVEAKQL
jgi:U3 small nucleolar RNA-associated protein MPP10